MEARTHPLNNFNHMYMYVCTTVRKFSSSPGLAAALATIMSSERVMLSLSSFEL